MIGIFFYRVRKFSASNYQEARFTRKLGNDILDTSVEFFT